VLGVDVPNRFDPSLFTVLARVKQAADAVYVRDQILATFAAARASEVPAPQLAEAKSHDATPSRGRRQTERIAAVVARMGIRRRQTVNSFTIAPGFDRGADVQRPPGSISPTPPDGDDAIAEPLPADMTRRPNSISPGLVAPEAARARPKRPRPGRRAASGDAPASSFRSRCPQLNLKLLFTAGSATIRSASGSLPWSPR
jgi:hypothetical protein